MEFIVLAHMMWTIYSRSCCASYFQAERFQLRFVRDDADVRLQQRDSRIAELQQEIDRILSEYQDLFELKVQLDTELRAYQSLLEGEESRY